MALRIKLRPWKNMIKKTHINAKELSLLGVCGERVDGERVKGEIRETHREGEGEKGGGGDMITTNNITQVHSLVGIYSKLVGTD